MKKLKSSLFACLLIALSFCFSYVYAQSGKKPKDKNEIVPKLEITDISFDKRIPPPPFFIEPGGMYELSLQAEGDISIYYWGVYLDMNGDGSFDGEGETLWVSESSEHGSAETVLRIPKDWNGRHTTIRIIVSEETIISPERIGHGGAFDEEDLPALIPFTSQIDTGLDEKHGGCIDLTETSASILEVSLGIVIPIDLIPADYSNIDVFIYGFDPNYNPLVFDNTINTDNTTYTTNLTPIPSNPNGEIALSIPLLINMNYFNNGDRVGYDACSMIFYMVVRGYRPGSVTPEIFYVQLDEGGSMPSIEYVVAQICECEIQGTQMDRKTHGEEVIVKVYPNPTQGHLFFEYDSETQVKVSILDMSGRVLVKYPLPAGSLKQSIYMNHLSSGLYIFELSDGKNRHHFKILKP